jgi:hypothetical protein
MRKKQNKKLSQLHKAKTCWTKNFHNESLLWLHLDFTCLFAEPLI